MKGSHQFILSAASAEALRKSMGLSEKEFLRHYVKQTASFARPPISNFFVGAAGVGVSGRVFSGVNLEFRGLPLAMSVHAEQFVLALMVNEGESGIKHLCINYAPCGHCRQFMKEYQKADDLSIDVITSSSSSSSSSSDLPQKLSDFLPLSFGPSDLNVTSCMMNTFRTPHNLNIIPPSPSSSSSLSSWNKDPLLQLCLQRLCCHSHAPYSLCPSAVALRTKQGKLYAGAYIESAAYNPSLPPAQSCIVTAVAAHVPYEDIERVVLLERADGPISQEETTRATFRSIAPTVKVEVYHVGVTSKL